jgi:hypothetical protein
VNDPYRIVAEISKIWLRGQSPDGAFLNQKFEDVIEQNRVRGYQLESWQFCQSHSGTEQMVETIIAVFVRE